jgi:ComF family protein
MARFPAMLKGRIHGFGERLGRVLLPPLCLACRVPVGSNGALCPECWQGVTFITPPVCERLGTPLPYALGPGALSAEAIEHPPAFDRARAAFLFDGVGRQLVHGLKFSDRPALAETLAVWMKRAGAELLSEADLLVPVPLHWTRLFRRRFNQSAELARHLSHLTGLPHRPQALRRLRATAHQTGLDRDARHDNVADAFALGSEGAEIVGRKVLLIDDVLTTGATVDACARLLRRSGAVRIDVLAAARVVDKA